MQPPRPRPPAQSATPNFAPIDDALGQVRTYNLNHPTTPLRVKLRVYQGANAPAWAKAIGGGPVPISRNSGGCAAEPCPLTVGKFWTADYIAAWRSFQAALAARYDGDPLVAQVAVTSCAAQTDEPFVVSTEAPSIAALAAAGYTDDAEKACLAGALDDYAAWKTTLVDYAFNPFEPTVRGDAGAPDASAAASDPAFTIGVMQDCRTRLGARCVLNNHALGVPVRPGLVPVYDEMKTLGGPVNFQTNAPKIFNCLWLETVAQAMAYGASSIELWPAAKLDGFDALGPADIQKRQDEFTSPMSVPDPLPATTCPTFN